MFHWTSCLAGIATFSELALSIANLYVLNHLIAYLFFYSPLSFRCISWYRAIFSCDITDFHFNQFSLDDNNAHWLDKQRFHRRIGLLFLVILRDPAIKPTLKQLPHLHWKMYLTHDTYKCTPFNWQTMYTLRYLFTALFPPLNRKT